MAKLFPLFEICLIILLCFEITEGEHLRPEVEDNEEKFSDILGTLTLGITMAK